MNIFGRLFSAGRTLDWWLYLLPGLLVGMGIAVITSLTYGTPRISLAINQSIYAVIGIALMIILSRIDYRAWRSLAPSLYVGVLGLLLAVASFGSTILGAKRWLTLGFFQLQPSELAKLVLIMVLARYFADRDQLTLADYFRLVVLVGAPVLLVMLQPDLGTAMILLLASFGLFYAGGVSRRVLAGVVVAGLVAAPIAWEFMAGYQRQRILTFLHPSDDPFGAGYNVLQALIAVGSGGLFGQGLGHGSQSQLQFLPVAQTDFIFSGVAEATGLVGSILLIALLVALIFRVVRVAQYSKDQFGFLLAVGFAILLLSQMTINIGMNLSLAPVTGIPLPFVSHGGTALIINFMGIGIMQSIYRRHKKISF